MKKWIDILKQRYTKQPDKRFALAFWLGVMFHVGVSALIQDWQGKEAYLALVEEHWTTMHWGWWVPFIIVTVYLYIRNALSFRKETLWMTIKNPAKVTREADDLTFPNRPIAPPPPGGTPGSSRVQQCNQTPTQKPAPPPAPPRSK